jgi:hypothetical protein
MLNVRENRTMSIENTMPVAREASTCGVRTHHARLDTMPLRVACASGQSAGRVRNGEPLAADKASAIPVLCARCGTRMMQSIGRLWAWLAPRGSSRCYAIGHLLD